MKYLQNSFSIAWSKLTVLGQLIYKLEDNRDNSHNSIQSPEKLETETFSDDYVHITDWVEPSIYFSIFCPHKIK